MKFKLLLFLLLLLITQSCEIFEKKENEPLPPENRLIYEKLTIGGKVIRADNQEPIPDMVVQLFTQGYPEEFEDKIDNGKCKFTTLEGEFNYYVYPGYYIYTYLPDGSLYSKNGPFYFSFSLRINIDDEGLYNFDYGTKSDNIGTITSDYYYNYNLSINE